MSESEFEAAPPLEPPSTQVVEAPVAPSMPLVTARRLIPAAFDLLVKSSEDMRRASFYIGAIVLGTVEPIALAGWGMAVVGLELSEDEMVAGMTDSGALAFAVLMLIAVAGFVVAAVESRTLAVAVLGGTFAGSPVSTRRALARSRRVFWRAVIASVVVAIVITVAQEVVATVLAPLVGVNSEINVVTSTLVTAVVGAPFAYVLAGVVLGDVDAFEAMKRSFRVYGVRKGAATVVAVFETLTALLVVLGISSGLDIVARIFDALGLGPESGPLGVAVVTVGIVALVFAFGTLLFTVMAITVAPQVVMFLGLTHATLGLDRVTRGGPDDPDLIRPRARPFRWFTMPMLAAFILAGIALASLLAGFV